MVQPGQPHATVQVWCDLGPSYGVGHLMRCLALAEELTSRGARVRFAVDADDLAAVPFARDQLAARGLEVVPTGTADPDVAVIDSYHLPESFYADLRARVPTLAIVDGDPAGRPADLWLDQNIGAEHDDWATPDGTTRLAGLRYALIRDDVLAARGNDRPGADGGAPRVFAFFGGTDAFGAAEVVVPALVATGAPLDLRVVGATPEIRERLGDDLSAGPGQRVTVLPPTDRLAHEAATADLVVSAAGTSSWELLCLGAACAVVAVAENQHTSYERAVATGAVAGLGHLDDVRRDGTAATAVLRRLLTDPEERTRLRAAAPGLVDGRGRVRVADALLLLTS